MAGGYRAAEGDEYEVLSAALQALSARLSELEAPTGTSLNSLVAQVQQAIADINTTVIAAINSTSYDAATIDAKIASPGTIAPVDVNASGSLVTPYGRANPVVTSWVAAAIDGSGVVAVQPSALKFKQDVQDYDGPSVDAFRVVTYVMIGDPKQTPHIGLIADEVNEIEPMAVAHDDGEPFALKYDALLGILLREQQRTNARLAALEG